MVMTQLTSFVGGIVIFLPLLIVSTLPWWLPAVSNAVTQPYIEHIQAITVSLLIWVVCSKVFEIDSIWFKRLMDASYSIYLFHHVIIVLTVLALNEINKMANIVINPMLAFMLVLIISVASTLFIHFCIVSKSERLRLLFNGK
jgi:glucan biosynthesis protein C